VERKGDKSRALQRATSRLAKDEAKAFVSILVAAPSGALLDSGADRMPVVGATPVRERPATLVKAC
jgi:hypothetical protein